MNGSIIVNPARVKNSPGLIFQRFGVRLYQCVDVGLASRFSGDSGRGINAWRPSGDPKLRGSGARRSEAFGRTVIPPLTATFERGGPENRWAIGNSPR